MIYEQLTTVNRIDMITILATNPKDKARREAFRLWNLSNQVEPALQKKLRKQARKIIDKWEL